MGARVTTRGRGVTRGLRLGGDKRGEKEGDTGVTRGVRGAGMRPGNPTPCTRGTLRVETGERGPGGQRG